MSIHKEEIESLLDGYTKSLAKGNMSAVNLIPHLVRAVVRYVEEATGTVPAAPAETPTESKIVPLPVPAPTLSGEDKAFATAVVAQHLEEHGNATVETDKGNVTIETDPSLLEDAEKIGVDAAGEVAKALVEEIVKEGVTEVKAVTAKTKPTTKK